MSTKANKSQFITYEADLKKEFVSLSGNKEFLTIIDEKMKEVVDEMDRCRRERDEADREIKRIIHKRCDMLVR